MYTKGTECVNRRVSIDLPALVWCLPHHGRHRMFWLLRWTLTVHWRPMLTELRWQQRNAPHHDTRSVVTWWGKHSIINNEILNLQLPWTPFVEDEKDEPSLLLRLPETWETTWGKDNNVTQDQKHFSSHEDVGKYRIWCSSQLHGNTECFHDTRIIN